MSSNYKMELYNFISCLRKQYPLLCYTKDRDIRNFCNVNNIELHLKDFDSKGLCGAAFVGEKHDTIILNSCRNKVEMTFDFIHELIHTKKHRNLNEHFFACFDGKQNTFIEWEANEGAAEFLVGYKIFIPLFCELYDIYVNNNALWEIMYGNITLHEELANRFCVTEMVIKNRINNLSYEIDQLKKGVDIEHIYLLSNNQQHRYNIQSTDYSNIISKLDLKYEFETSLDGVLSASNLLKR